MLAKCQTVYFVRFFDFVTVFYEKFFVFASLFEFYTLNFGKIW